MTAGDWFSTSENYVYLLITVPMLVAAYRVVTSRNVVHAVLYLVGALAASAALFLLLGAEFVAWTVVLVYIGAVVVLFLFGIMITRAPLGVETELSHPRRVRVPAAIVASALFLLIGGTMLDAFEDDALPSVNDQQAAYVGLGLSGAIALTIDEGRPWRITRQDDNEVTLASEPGFQEVSFQIDDGIVTAASIESAGRARRVGQSIFERFVIPFEVVSVVLLAALIGAIVLARKDPTAEEDADQPAEAAMSGAIQ